jgi:hypothetical protein
MDILCSLKTTIEKFDLTFKTCFPCDVEEHKKISHKLRLICDGPLWWRQNVMGGADVNGPWEEPTHHILSWFVASKGKLCFHLLRTSHGHWWFGWWCSSNHNMWNQVTMTKIYIALIKPWRWSNSCEVKPTVFRLKICKISRTQKHWAWSFVPCDEWLVNYNKGAHGMKRRKIVL